MDALYLYSEGKNFPFRLLANKVEWLGTASAFDMSSNNVNQCHATLKGTLEPFLGDRNGVFKWNGYSSSIGTGPGVTQPLASLGKL